MRMRDEARECKILARNHLGKIGDRRGTNSHTAANLPGYAASCSVAANFCGAMLWNASAPVAVTAKISDGLRRMRSGAARGGSAGASRVLRNSTSCLASSERRLEIALLSSGFEILKLPLERAKAVFTCLARRAAHDHSSDKLFLLSDLSRQFLPVPIGTVHDRQRWRSRSVPSQCMNSLAAQAVGSRSRWPSNRTPRGTQSRPREVQTETAASLPRWTSTGDPRAILGLALLQ
jgi:hypothetical protein